MKMTDEQRYDAVLKELGEVLANKGLTITCQQWEIDNLKEKLAAAEAERDHAKKMLVEQAREISHLRTSVEELKGGAA